MSARAGRIGSWMLVGLAGLAISALLVWQTDRLNEQRLREELERQATALVQEVGQRFRLYEYGLRGARGAVLAGGGAAIGRDTFAAYIDGRDPAREFPGARGFGFVRRVPAAEQADFERRARADGMPDFRIRQLAPHAGDLYVIEYVYPLSINRSASGLDIASEPNRRQAAMEAARTGTARLTAPITLLQAQSKERQGFLMLLPVYLPGRGLNSPEARSAATLGWTYAPLVAEEVLSALPLQFPQLRLRLQDAEADLPFYETQARAAGGGAEAIGTTRGFVVYGRQWTLQAEATEALRGSTQVVSSLVVAGAGTLLTLLLTLIARLLTAPQRTQGAQGLQGPGRGSPLAFVISPMGRWAAFSLVLVGGLYALAAWWQVLQAEVARTEAELIGLAEDHRARAEAAQRTHVSGLVYLRGTPPVDGLVRSDRSGVDPQDGSSTAFWQRRLGQIFAAYGNANAEVLALRLMRLHPAPQELVSWQRRTGAEALVGGSQALGPAQQLSLRELAPRLRADRPWTHPVQLEPASPGGALLPQLRHALPVFEQGQLFGVIEMTLDATTQLDPRALRRPHQVQVQVLGAGERLLADSLASEAAGRDTWSERYQSQPMPFRPPHDVLTAWRGPQGDFVTASARFDPNGDGSGDAALRFQVSRPVAAVHEAVRAEWQARLLLPAAVGLGLYLLLYVHWIGQRSQLSAQAQRVRMGLVLDQSQDAVIALDDEDRVSLWSRGAEALFGMPAAQALGRPLDASLPALAANLDLPSLVEAGRTVRELPGEAGAPRWLDIAASRGADEDRTQAYALTIRDVSDERQLQQRLATLNAELEQQVQVKTRDLELERERLSNILAGTDAGTWEWQVQSGETRFNERWAGIVGWRLEEMQPISASLWREQAHPEDMARARERLEAHFAGQTEQYAAEIRMRHREGHWVWVLERGRVLSRSADGKPEWMAGTRLDISQMKEAQLDLDRVATTLRSVLQAAVDFSIIATSPEGLITVFNAGAERLLGYAADEMVGRETPARIHLEAEVRERGMELSAQEGYEIRGFRVFAHLPDRDGAEQREWTYVRKDGCQVPVLLTVSPVRDARRRVVGYLGIAQDISERKRIERSLRHAKIAAEAASAAKSMFLANMSHEIRTPMNAVLGIAHLLDDTPLNADQRQLLSKLQISGRTLMGIINDVLDLAKIEAGELKVERIAYQPAELLQEMEALYADAARARGLSWTLQRDESLPPTVLGDPQRIRQVLVNLLSNALKFTAEGGIRLRLEAVNDGAPGLRWIVSDTGIGIAPEALGRLFQPFIQAEATTTRQYGGTGLGLSIVQRLADLMGGSAQVRSEPGRGSEFELRLPLLLPDAEAPSETPLLTPLEVVVVEDDAVQRERLVSLGTRFGWLVREWERAEPMLDEMRRRIAEQRPLPEVLLMDWQLGAGMDGLSALSALARLIEPAAMPAALLITQHQREALQHTDVDDLVHAVLTKPANASALFNAVNEAIARKQGSSERVLQATQLGRIKARLLPEVRLLVVDDSEINLEVAQRMLQRQGAEVVCESSPLRALKRLGDGERFDAVLMDIQMPGMNGYEATGCIRLELGLDALPVIALTAGALPEERRRALAAGMSDFLTKPLDPEALVRCLRRHIEASRKRPLPATTAESRALGTEGWPEIEGIVSADAALRLGGDVSLFQRLLRRMLVAFGPEWQQQMQALLAAGDRAELAAQLHKLRGSAGLLGAQALQTLATEGEALMRDASASAQAGAQSVAAVAQALRELALQAHAQLPAEDEAPRSDAPLLPDAEQRYAELLEMLRQQDMGAAEALLALRPWLLAQGLPPADCARLLLQLQELDYPPALEALRRWRDT